MKIISALIASAFILLLSTTIAQAKKGQLFLSIDYMRRKVDGRGLFGCDSRPNLNGTSYYIQRDFDVNGKSNGYDLGYGWNNNWLNGLRFQAGFRLSKRFTLAAVFRQDFNKNSHYGENSTKYVERSICFSALVYPITPFFLEIGVENAFTYAKNNLGFETLDDYSTSYGLVLGGGIEYYIYKDVFVRSGFSYAFLDCNFPDSKQFLVIDGFGTIYSGNLRLKIGGPRVNIGLGLDI